MFSYNRICAISGFIFYGIGIACSVFYDYSNPSNVIETILCTWGGIVMVVQLFSVDILMMIVFPFLMQHDVLFPEPKNWVGYLVLWTL